MHTFKISIFAFVILASLVGVVRAQPNVVASIKPVHSLVAGVMQGVSKPQVIVEGAGSPHSYAMKPSQAVMLQDADLVFWIGPDVEAFLEKPLATLASRARLVRLLDADGLIKLPLRQAGAFGRHTHGKSDSHGHAPGSDHGHTGDSASRKQRHRTRRTVDHNKAGINPHIWLDPINAKILVRAIKTALVKTDPGNAAIYERNALALSARLDELVVELATVVEPLRGRGFVVFHDAYQYFEIRFGLTASGTITVSPEVVPGAKRVRDLRAKVNQLRAACVFSEPQFQPKLVRTIVEGTDARSGVLDPLGASLDSGAGLYFKLIRNMASAFKSCLSG